MDAKSYPGLRASIVLIMLAQVAALAVRSYLDLTLSDLGFDAEAAKNLSYLVVPLIEIALLWPLLRSNKTLLLALLRRPQSWRRVILTGVALGAAARISGWGAIIGSTSLGWPGYATAGLGTTLNYRFECPGPLEMLLAMATSALLIPIGEEVINRGLVLGKILPRGRLQAILGSSILFAILHSPGGMFAAFLFGAGFALLVIRTGSLLPGIIAHATYNVLRLFDWVCSKFSWHPQELTPETALIGVLALVLSCLGLAIASWIVVHANTGTNKSSR